MQMSRESNLNTSHVILYRKARNVIKKCKEDLNTSHVILYPQAQTPWLSAYTI